MARISTRVTLLYRPSRRLVRALQQGRTRRGFQRQIARAACIKPTLVARMARGEAHGGKVYHRGLLKVAQALGLSPGEALVAWDKDEAEGECTTFGMPR